MGATPIRRRPAIGLRAARSICVGLLVAACSGPSAPASANVDATGILFVGVEEQVQSRFTTEAMAQILSDEQQLAEANGEDVGYPWLDPSTGELVLSAVTPRGRQLLETGVANVPHRIRDVAHGASELQRILDGVTFLNAQGVQDANLIYETAPDQRDNRALIVISAMSRSLLDYLAAHYPPDAIAIRIQPR